MNNLVSSTQKDKYVQEQITGPVIMNTQTHYSIWNQNVTTSKFHKVNSYLGCSQFLRVPQKRFNVKSNP